MRSLYEEVLTKSDKELFMGIVPQPPSPAVPQFIPQDTAQPTRPLPPPPPARKNAFEVLRKDSYFPAYADATPSVSLGLISASEVDVGWLSNLKVRSKVYLLTEKELADLEAGARTIINVPIEGGTIDYSKRPSLREPSVNLSEGSEFPPGDFRRWLKWLIVGKDAFYDPGWRHGLGGWFIKWLKRGLILVLLGLAGVGALLYFGVVDYETLVSLPERLAAEVLR